MTACHENTRPPVIWRLLFTFVFLEYLKNYLCFIIFTNILIHKLLFFIVFTPLLHLDELIRVFPLLSHGDIEVNPGPKKDCPFFLSLEFK